MNKKIAFQGDKCALCLAEFTDYGDVVPDHTNPRGMSRSWRDDHPDNIQAVHCGARGEKGMSSEEHGELWKPAQGLDFGLVEAGLN